MSRPDHGYFVSVEQAGFGYGFVVVGPMAEGSWLRRIRVFWCAEATTLLTVGLALGSVPEASAVAYGAASALIYPGSWTRQGHPAISMTVVGAAQGWFDVPCGLEIYSGARYVIGYVQSSVVDAGVTVSFALECVRA